MKFILFFVALSFLWTLPHAQGADLNLSPSSLQLKVYKFAVSTSPLCTNLITVVDNGSTPQAVEFVGGIDIGSGTVPDGTYPCVVIEFEDEIAFTPAQNSTSTNCSTSQEETLDVCRSGTSQLIDGSTSTCVVGPNKATMYLSTTSTEGSGSPDAFNPPTQLNDPNLGFNLSAALTVAGATRGKFVVNATGKVCDNATAGCDGGGGGGTECRMEPPLFGFSQL